MLKVNNRVEAAEIFLYGDIVDDDDAAGDPRGYQFPAKLKAELDAIGADKPIEVHINSDGGSVFAGVAMANFISRHKGKTTAYNDGLVASIAGQIYFACDECVSPPNCYFMLHQPFTATQGNAVELRKTADVLDTLQAGLETTYRRKARAGVTASEIRTMLESETWLTGEQAATKFKIRLVEPSKVMNTAAVVGKLKARGVKVPSALERSNTKMKRSDELRQQIEAKRAEVGHYQYSGDYGNRLRAENELRTLQDALDAVARKEEENLRSFAAAVRGSTPTGATVIHNGYSSTDMARLRNRAYNKLVLSGARGTPANLTPDERDAYYNISGSPGSPGQIEALPSRGGYLVSQEQLKTLQEYRSAFVALKNYVTVVTTATSYGRWPTLPDQAIEFAPLVELTDVAEGDIQFSELEYRIADYGFVIPCSNQLLEDADVSLVDVIGRTLAKAAVRTENKKILEPLNKLIVGDTATGTAAATVITDYRALNTALYRTLDGTFEPSAKLFVNQDSFVWLSNLEDGNNRPLMVPDVTEASKYLYRGKEIVVLPNTVLPNNTVGASTLAPILIGDLASYLTFFERKGLELSTSAEAFWRKNAIGVRAICRFDCVVTDARAMVALQVAV